MYRAVLALLIGIAALATPAHAKWQEASHQRFLIYGDMSPARMQKFARELERFDAAMHHVYPQAAMEVGAANRVTIYLVQNTAKVRKLHGNSRSVAGFYMALAQGSIIVAPQSIDDEDADFNARIVLLHEYAHHVTLASTGGYLPGWTAEGLAELFSTAKVKPDGSVMIGAANVARAYDILDVNPMRADRLLTSDWRKLNDAEEAQKYARGWLLVHYLMLGKRNREFGDYLRLVNEGVPAEKAGEQAFGDLKKLDAALNQYRSRSTLGAVLVTADRIPASPIAVRELDAAEAAMMPLRIESATGVDTAEAKALVAKGRAVAAAFPASAPVQRALAEMEYDAGNDDAALAACERALAIDPRNVMAMVYAGRVHARRAAAAAPADPAMWKAARRWYLKANAVDNDFALPFVLFHQSFIDSGQKPSPSAVQGLVRAMELVPQDAGLRLAVTMQMLADNNVPAARAALAPVAFAPHSGSDNPARALLTLIDSGVDAPAIIKAMPKPSAPEPQ